MQSPGESYTDFLSRLPTAIVRAVTLPEVQELLLESLAYKNANAECQRTLRPLKAQGAPLEEYIKACQDVASLTHQANLLAGASQKGFQSSQMKCYQCGKLGHFRKNCRRENKGREKVEYTKPPGRGQAPTEPCRRCGKGFHSKRQKWKLVVGKREASPLHLGPRENNLGLQSPVSSGLPHQMMQSESTRQRVRDLIHATAKGAALDIPAPQRFTLIPDGGVCKLSTNIFGPLPEGTVGLIVGQSSYTSKGIFVHTGVIDEDYDGEIRVMVSVSMTTQIAPGERFAQILLLPYVQGKAAPVRRTGGFGLQGNRYSGKS
uniref:CCHC-type domain-containing protein n=1 Tax=Rousettus aegyptiacus TaxID=9407 RepID=A0A7J8H1A4_ROUAE|nr:hypothetical protein HJG63_011395 [Rousettus aegyptiacus]